MLNGLRHFLAISLIALAGLIQPHFIPTQKTQVKQTPVINISLTSKQPSMISPTIKPVMKQRGRCQFNKEQLTTLMQQNNYSNEDINLFFSVRPGDCFNFKPNYQKSSQDSNMESTLNDLNQKQQQIDQNLQNTQNCQNQTSNYVDCVNQNNQAMQQYNDCLSSTFNRYCSKPINTYCYKPSCAY